MIFGFIVTKMVLSFTWFGHSKCTAYNKMYLLRALALRWRACSGGRDPKTGRPPNHGEDRAPWGMNVSKTVTFIVN